VTATRFGSLTERRPLRITTVDPSLDRRWDAFVASRLDGLVYHHSTWLRALEREYGVRPLAFVCEGPQDEVLGILPLLQTRGLPMRRHADVTGARLSSLPRTPVAGPLAVDAVTLAAVVAAAVERTRAEPGVSLQLKAQTADLDASVKGLTRIAWRESYSVALPARPEDLRFGNSRNHGAIKRAVNKAAKSGVRVRAAESEVELRAWYRLYLEAMRWHAVPPRPYRFFLALWELLRPRGLMRLLVAELEGRLVAGSVLLMFGQTVFYAFNGRRRGDLSLRPNDALHWRALHDACAEGYRRYDFGEVPVGNEGLARFKSKWGTETALLYRYYYPPPEKVERVDAVGGSRGGQLARAAWRALPLRATAHLGDALWRYA
jgi:CelD/BcsL family acetyltransferase involved in cellulose biosynthesis